MYPKTYLQFSKLTKDQQGQLVINKKQSPPTPFPVPTTFPQTNFIPLTSKQQNIPIKLSTHRYPAKITKAVIILFHTVGCYTTIYSNTAKYLASNGITVVGYDQRGHGKSQGQRGYYDSANQMLTDAKLFITNIFKNYPNIPIFIMGHGAGGLFSLICVKQFKQFKFKGVILISSGFKKPIHNKLLSVVSDIALTIMPKKAGLFQFQFQNITSNPNVCDYLRNNPDVYHGKIYAGTMVQMISFMQKIQQSTWKNIETPSILIMQGQFDKIADPINAINFYQTIKTKDKQLQWYPNMWNFFVFQPELNQINAKLVAWVTSRI